MRQKGLCWCALIKVGAIHVITTEKQMQRQSVHSWDSTVVSLKIIKFVHV